MFPGRKKSSRVLQTSTPNTEVNSKERFLPAIPSSARGKGEWKRKGRETEKTCLPVYASALLHQINFTLSHLPVTMMSFIHQFGVAMETLAGVVLVWPFCDTVCFLHILERTRPSLSVRCSVVIPPILNTTHVCWGEACRGYPCSKAGLFQG